jgi:hypothetical protein
MPKDTIYSAMSQYEGVSPDSDADGAIPNIAYLRRIVAKTADYTCLLSDSGTIFTNVGHAASLMTFTLPAVAVSKGVEYYFANYIDAGITVTAGTTTMVTWNNAGATSLSATSTGNSIGTIIHVFCDGSFWYTSAEVSGITTVLTVA